MGDDTQYLYRNTGRHFGRPFKSDIINCINSQRRDCHLNLRGQCNRSVCIRNWIYKHEIPPNVRVVSREMKHHECILLPIIYSIICLATKYIIPKYFLNTQFDTCLIYIYNVSFKEVALFYPLTYLAQLDFSSEPSDY